MAFYKFDLYYFTVIVLLLFIEATLSYRLIQYRQMLPLTSINSMILSAEIDPYAASLKHVGLRSSSPINTEDSSPLQAYGCSLMECPFDSQPSAVCACNFNTGKVVTFKNQCDLLKHNCRFDTNFRVILNEICPWEFQSRRHNSEVQFDYNDPKYYN